MKEPKFSVGQRIWRFDQNHRVYVDEDGRKTSGPVFTGYFLPATVVSADEAYYEFQTSAGGMIRKSPRREVEKTYMDDRGRDEMIWKDARYRISEAVRDSDLDALRRVAEVIGYRPRGLCEDMEPAP